ncbi:hypothetical protein [Sphingomonas phyllosphaerae]|uniref:hypothetical protein n=1 Tax=Sphingomonas phyllosphaerae TaxID=257003 RepID=UPI0003F4CA0E|nr:hypothetical protein [Sphingomonas phyllosphaerae]
MRSDALNPSASQLLDGIPFEESVRKKRYPVHRMLERAAAGVTTFDLTRRSSRPSTSPMS